MRVPRTRRPHGAHRQASWAPGAFRALEAPSARSVLRPARPTSSARSCLMRSVDSRFGADGPGVSAVLRFRQRRRARSHAPPSSCGPSAANMRTTPITPAPTTAVAAVPTRRGCCDSCPRCQVSNSASAAIVALATAVAAPTDCGSTLPSPLTRGAAFPSSSRAPRCSLCSRASVRIDPERLPDDFPGRTARSHLSRPVWRDHRDRHRSAPRRRRHPRYELRVPVCEPCEHIVDLDGGAPYVFALVLREREMRPAAVLVVADVADRVARLAYPETRSSPCRPLQISDVSRPYHGTSELISSIENTE